MKVSVIIPLYNEEENLLPLYEELKGVLSNLPGYEYEVIFVDDGSIDSSLQILKELKLKDPNIRVLSLDKNYGQSTALKAGFDKACGELIITMDADLQNDPNDIPKLLKYIEEGYDLVSGWRRKRKDPFLKRIASKIANGVRNRITGERIKDTGCTLKIYRAEYLRRVKLFNGMHRFLPTLLKLEGARVIEVEVNHRERRHGKSKYGIGNRLVKPLIDTFVVLWMKRNFINYKAKEEL